MSTVTLTIEDVDGGVSLDLKINPELKTEDEITNAIHLGAAAYQYIEHILNKAVKQEGGDVVSNC